MKIKFNNNGQYKIEIKCFSKDGAKTVKEKDSLNGHTDKIFFSQIVLIIN
jgi:hypothetical protein